MKKVGTWLIAGFRARLPWVWLFMLLVASAEPYTWIDAIRWRPESPAQALLIGGMSISVGILLTVGQFWLCLSLVSTSIVRDLRLDTLFTPDREWAMPLHGNQDRREVRAGPSMWRLFRLIRPDILAIVFGLSAVLGVGLTWALLLRSSPPTRGWALDAMLISALFGPFAVWGVALVVTAFAVMVHVWRRWRAQRVPVTLGFARWAAAPVLCLSLDLTTVLLAVEVLPLEGNYGERVPDIGLLLVSVATTALLIGCLRDRCGPHLPAVRRWLWAPDTGDTSAASRVLSREKSAR